MTEFEAYEPLLDERHSEIFYNGGFTEGDDPCDYISVKEAVKNG